MTMNLNEIREIVDFMKEVGLVELAYTEKNTSVKLKLAEPECCCGCCDCCEETAEKETPATETVEEEATADAAQAGEFDPTAVIDTAEVRQAAADAAAEVRKAATRAAELVSMHLKDGAAILKDGADYIKTKRDERMGNTQPEDEIEVVDGVVADVVLDEEDDCSETAPAAEPPVVEEATEQVEVAETAETAETVEEAEENEDAPAAEGETEEKESVKLDTGAAKVAVIKTAETLFNTARAGASFGKAGLKRGKGILTSLFAKQYDPEPEEVKAEVEVTDELEAEVKAEETK